MGFGAGRRRPLSPIVDMWPEMTKVTMREWGI